MNPQTLWQALRATVTPWRRTPGLTAGALFCLALATGIGTISYTVVDSLLGEPIPGLEDPHRALLVATDLEDPETPAGYLSYLDYRDLAETAESFSELAAFATFKANLSQGDKLEAIRTAAVTGNYFEVTGATPVLGNAPWTEEGSGKRTAVVGHGLWQRLLGADPSALGSSLYLNGESFTVTGVMAEGFRGVQRTLPTELWIPLAAYAEVASGPLAALSGQFDRQQEWLMALGRVKPGVDIETARGEVALIGERLVQEYPDTHHNDRIEAVTARDFAFGSRGRERVERYLMVLAAVAGLFFLLAGGTVANLLVAQGLERRREFAIRLCLGAERRDLFRRLLAGGVLLGLLGGVLGLLGAWAILPLLERIELPVTTGLSLQLDAAVACFAVSSALGVSGVASLFPFFRLRSAEPLAALSGESRPDPWFRRVGGSDLLVVSQMAITLVLLVGAGLFLRSLHNVESLHSGFEAEDVLIFDLDLSASGLPPAGMRDLYEQTLERLEGSPQIERASLAAGLPILGVNLDVRLDLAVDGVETKEPIGVHYALVGTDFFETAGVSILRGRGFSPEDSDSSTPVVVVDESLTERFGITTEPLGRTVRLAGGDRAFQIVGVAEAVTPVDRKQGTAPVVYLHHDQSTLSMAGTLMGASMTVIARTSGDLGAAASHARQTVQGIEEGLPPLEVSSLDSKLAEAVAVERQLGSFLALLGAAGCGIAFFGLYALLTQAVLQRRRELAVRVAVGASSGSIMGLVLKRAVLLSLLAVGLGLVGARFFGGLAKSQLYGVSPGDPLTLASLAVALILFALAVAFVPARRATRTDPREALQADAR